MSKEREQPNPGDAEELKLPEDAVNPNESSANAPAGDASESMSLEEQLQATRAERDENFNKFLRAQAELDNYRKRTQRDRDEERRFASLPVTRDLLPAMDNLQRAIDAAAQTQNVDELTSGVQMVLRQIEEVLSRFGVTPITAVGEPFDPNLHEAVQQIPTSDHPPMTVIQELERGYTLHDRVVRPSKVIVSAELPAAADQADTESTDES
ncbi:heat shock protein GrpE [Maioricimonas rarisocia]|uniref:Protein GrpE n=1 Tax=Maioricimonas rarisocia TaxID=2528026 RepID=A0A517Z8K8_9PLAN|nr:nucleotide exchange factor GrpE [Maioricimonas rarisocia]QDU38789.1 heat shock protein GrpE [Maioricimonas rarisocia]